MDDLYATLGVAPSSTIEQIKERYRFLAQAYHPDKFASERHKLHAEHVFKRINAAFHVLSDPNLRADYDRRYGAAFGNKSQSNDADRQPPPPPAAGSSHNWAAVGLFGFIIMLAIGAIWGLFEKRFQKPSQAKQISLTSAQDRSVPATPSEREMAPLSPAGLSAEPFTISDSIWKLVERNEFLNKTRYERIELGGRKFPQQLHVYNEPLDTSADYLAAYFRITEGVFVKTESLTPASITITMELTAGPKHITTIETWPTPDPTADRSAWLRKLVESTLSDIDYMGFSRQLETDTVSVEQLRADAERGDVVAQCNLGAYCMKHRAHAEAAKWYRMAADQGHADAQHKLGVCYENGTGVPRDNFEAARWYRMAAEQGLNEAQCALGICYGAGLGVAEDLVEAYKWLHLTSAQGNESSRRQMLNILKQRMTPEQIAEARRLADAFVPRKPGFDERSVEQLMIDAKRGDPGSQTRLGSCYARGDGVSRDYAEAARWYRMAAEQGNASGQFRLGVCYAVGEGVPQNHVEAAKWYRKAAEQGDAAGQAGLGFSYERGEGVPQDYIEACKWYNLASAQGHAVARNNRAVIERLMTPDQIAKAQRLAREFMPVKAPD